jgi:hypothetical protein
MTGSKCDPHVIYRTCSGHEYEEIAARSEGVVHRAASSICDLGGRGRHQAVAGSSTVISDFRWIC